MFPDCSGAATEDGVTGRDKTSSSELGVQVPPDGHGSTCLVHARRDAMSDFASSLTWFGDGWSMHGDPASDFASSSTWRCLVHTWRDVDGDRKVSMEAMVQPATSMHGEMRCRGFSSSLFGLSTARQTLRPHALQSSCLESKSGDVDLLPDVSTC